MRGAICLSVVLLAASAFGEGQKWVQYEGQEGPGEGKRVVIVTGDDEYRSEESMPAFGKILAVHHGFDVSVLFAIDRETGAIDPSAKSNIPGLHLLDEADLMILFTRFRHLPDEEMKHIIDYTNSGKPILGLRTATHAFAYPKDSESPYKKYSWDYHGRDYRGGYGRQVLGETWVNHHGHHQVESTRGVIPFGMKGHPIAKGVEDIWGPSDVYGVRELTGDAKPVVYGEVLEGMNPDDPVNKDKEVLPVAWIKHYTGDTGNTARVFTTTMGHGGDFKSEGFRRLLVNAVYWLLEMEPPEKATVEFVGDYEPTPIGFGKYKQGVMPKAHALE